MDEFHLSVDFWIDQTPYPDEILMRNDAIALMVREAYQQDLHMVDLKSWPESMDRDGVIDLIRSISKPGDDELRYLSGTLLTSDDYGRYEANANLDQVPDSTTVRFGMVVERANMRTWPSEDVAIKSRETRHLDRFQENGLFPGDAVAILHESQDGRWYFVQSYNYAAWVLKDKVAIGDRTAILEYQSSNPFIVITGNSVMARGDSKASPEVQLEMGTRLPLSTSDDSEVNQEGVYQVTLPTRLDDGSLKFRESHVECKQDVHAGFLPYSRRNILQQAFKFLGERYGWGHSYNARDCTGLVLEVFKSFGFALPRNSGQQGQSEIGTNHFFSEQSSADEKLKVLHEADVGDLLYSPGHVMLYLGRHGDEHYVIHDVSGSGWIDNDGNYQDDVFKGVSVTPLTRVHSSPAETYFERMYAIKRLR